MLKNLKELLIMDDIKWQDLELIEANKIHLPGLHLLTSSKKSLSFFKLFFSYFRICKSTI